IWTFNLQPLASTWDRLGNTGAAIVPRALPLNGQAAPAPSSAVNWSITLLPNQTKATVSYGPGGSSSSISGPAPAPAFAGGLSLAAPPPPVTAPPPPKTALPPAAAQPTTASRAPIGTVPLSKVVTQKVWLG